MSIFDQDYLREIAQQFWDDRADKESAANALASKLEHDAKATDWDTLAADLIDEAEHDQQCEAASERPENP